MDETSTNPSALKSFSRLVEDLSKQRELVKREAIQCIKNDNLSAALGFVNLALKLTSQIDILDLATKAM